MGFFGSAPEKQPQTASPAPAAVPAKKATQTDDVMAVIAAAVAACADDGRIAAIAAAIAICTGGGTVACIKRLDSTASWTKYARVAAVTARNEMF